jgi:hypothetical protein
MLNAIREWALKYGNITGVFFGIVVCLMTFYVRAKGITEFPFWGRTGTYKMKSSFLPFMGALIIVASFKRSWIKENFTRKSKKTSG